MTNDEVVRSGNAAISGDNGGKQTMINKPRYAADKSEPVQKFVEAINAAVIAGEHAMNDRDASLKEYSAAEHALNALQRARFKLYRELGLLSRGEELAERVGG